MKRLKTILPILSAVILVSCSNPVSSHATTSTLLPTSSAQSGEPSSLDSSAVAPSSAISSTPISSASSGASSANAIYQFPATVDINIAAELAYTNLSHEYEFLLPEFGALVFETRAIPDIREYTSLYFNNNKIIDQMDYSSLFAADLNNDNYREIICTAGKNIIVYDVRNNREMLNKNVSTDDVSYLNNVNTPYRYSFVMNKNKVVLKIWNGSRTESNYDYACFSYDKNTHSLYLNAQNMYEIQDFGYDSISLRDEVVQPVGDQYTFQKGYKYVINFHVTRKENADLDKVIVGYSNTKDVLPSGGIFALLNDQRLGQDNAKTVSKTRDGFGDYELVLTIPNDANEQGIIRVGFASLDFRIAYKIA